MEYGTKYNLEEKLNTISHGIGVLFGVVGLFFLLQKNNNSAPYAVFSIIVYSLSFIVLFSASTLYHYSVNPKIKNKLRVLDHVSIYMLIAGTYTPIALITLEKNNGWMIFGIVWGITLVGTVLKLFFTGKFEYVSLLLYLVMGWLIVLDFENLKINTTDFGLNLLFIGGGLYSFGVIFYAIKKIPLNHFIWHLFVLGGAVSHWLFIYYDVV